MNHHHRSGHWSNAPRLSKARSAFLAIVCLLWAVALIAWVWVMP